MILVSDFQGSLMVGTTGGEGGRRGGEEWTETHSQQINDINILVLAIWVRKHACIFIRWKTATELQTLNVYGYTHMMIQ